MMDHDRYFKELLNVFFDEFLEAFFPQVYQSLDLTNKRFLSEELFPDLIQGDKKRADVIAEAKYKDGGKDCVLIIHLEAQNYHQNNFPQRMFTYFAMIYLKFRKPVLPIAIFSYDGVRDEPDQFRIRTPFLETLSFRYFKMELRRMNWRLFMNANNPASAALMCKMNYRPEERVALRISFLKQLARMHLDEARGSIAFGFFETYLKLNDQEEKEFMKQTNDMPEELREEVLKWPNSFYDRGKEEGKREGKKEGKREGNKETAIRLLKMGIDVVTVSKATDLNQEEIKELQRKIL
jgi:predicted transposase/invertase (TIGR01784 family)